MSTIAERHESPANIIQPLPSRREGGTFLRDGRIFADQLIHTLREVVFGRNIRQQARDEAL